MNELEYRNQLVEVGRSLFARGYATGGAGNISVRMDNGRILATPTGSSLGRLNADTLSVVDLEGMHLSGQKASKEVQFHLALYRQKDDCGAVVHLHSTYLTALSCLEGLNLDNAIKPFTPYYVMRVGRLPVVPYFRPGHSGIARELARLAPDHRAFLLANHGPVVTGKDLLDACDNSEELEETARLALLLKDIPVRHLTEEEVNELSGGIK